MIDTATAWAAFEARDRAQDGAFVGAVRTTGIYCKPSCPARHPRQEHVEFFTTPAEARAAGYRACLRCHPDAVGRDREAVAPAVRMIEAAEDQPRLADWRRRWAMRRTISSGCSRANGGVARGLCRAVRARRAEAELEQEKPVTEAMYDAGYAAPSRFYAERASDLG